MLCVSNSARNTSKKPLTLRRKTLILTVSHVTMTMLAQACAFSCSVVICISLLCCQIVQLFKVRKLGNGLPVPVMRLLCYVPVMRGLLHTLQIRVTLLLVLAVNKLVNANNDFGIISFVFSGSFDMSANAFWLLNKPL